MNLRLVRDILEYRGHHVDVATNVSEARVWLTGPPPDLVLLDVQIPGGGGALVLRELRTNLLWSTVPVLAVTALAMEGDRERLLASGFDGYLSKPIDTRSFGSVVESFLVDKESGDDL